jgi:hypothetical protein
VKRTIFIVIVFFIAAGAGWFWWKDHSKEIKATETKNAEEKTPEESRIKRDELGRITLQMNGKIQQNIGLLVSQAESAHYSPEIKGYGRVLDPTSLATLLAELAVAQASYTATSNEWVRLALLAVQTNASQRALQTAEAAARRDQIAVIAARDRLLLAWGQAISDHQDLPGLMQSLTAQKSALIRIDLPVGNTVNLPPGTIRITTLSGEVAEPDYLGMAPSVDPQMLGQAMLFLLRTNTLGLQPGAAVIGYLKAPGDPLNGVIIPRKAVVQSGGANWIYIMNSGGETFTRLEIPLDHPTVAGWFITNGVTANDKVVTAGAQTLLSEELKSSMQAD